MTTQELTAATDAAWKEYSALKDAQEKAAGELRNAWFALNRELSKALLRDELLAEIKQEQVV